MTGPPRPEAARIGEICQAGRGRGADEPPWCKRTDDHDQVLSHRGGKYQAVVEAIREGQCKGPAGFWSAPPRSRNPRYVVAARHRPASAATSRNARQQRQEAQIVADAGSLARQTIATNMAGRGTDIQLGGASEGDEAMAAEDESRTNCARGSRRSMPTKRRQTVLAAGGLFIVGTERHDRRRIDNQLRRPLAVRVMRFRSLFFLSLEDDLDAHLRSERLDAVPYDGMKEAGIVHLGQQSLERAQAKVEGRNFDIRKQLLKFDDDERPAQGDLQPAPGNHAHTDEVEVAADMRQQVIDDLVGRYAAPRLCRAIRGCQGPACRGIDRLNMDLPIAEWAAEDGVDQ